MDDVQATRHDGRRKNGVERLHGVFALRGAAGFFGFSSYAVTGRGYVPRRTLSRKIEARKKFAFLCKPDSQSRENLAPPWGRMYFGSGMPALRAAARMLSSIAPASRTLSYSPSLKIMLAP
jgi:hypothetical protein